jgi:hypothetical protein
MGLLALDPQDGRSAHSHQTIELGVRRGMDPVLAVAERYSGFGHGLTDPARLLSHGVKHRLARESIGGPIVGRVVRAEEAAQRLLADDVLAGLGGGQDHGDVQVIRHAQVNRVNAGIGQQRPPVAFHARNAELLGERAQAIRVAAANGGYLELLAIDLAVGCQMEMCGEAAADDGDPHRVATTHSRSSLPLVSGPNHAARKPPRNTRHMVIAA